MALEIGSTIPKPWFNGRAPYLLTALLVLVVGGGISAYLFLTPRGVSGRPEANPGPLVTVFKADKRGTSHRVAITAYGTSQAGQEWTAIAEVAGPALTVHPRFEPGEILPPATVLVQIDPTDYGLAVERLEAEVRAQQQQKHELDTSEANLKEIKKLQESQLDLADKQRDRQRLLKEQNATSQNELEMADNVYLARKTALQETENSLSLIPVKRELLQASLDAIGAQLRQAARNRDKCRIRLPMAARCVSKSVEQDQYILAGERLGSFLTLGRAEVVAMVEAHKLAALFPSGIPELKPQDLARMDHTESLWRRVKVPVEVRWESGERVQVWQGRLARLGSSLDPLTRTIPAIVEVLNPYRDTDLSVRPPLLPDVFCHVTLYGDTVRDVVVIPRDCLRRVPRSALVEKGSDDELVDVVYLLRPPSSGQDQAEEQGEASGEPLRGTLHLAEVEVTVLEDDVAVIGGGIDDGDWVIRIDLTDLFPAVEGMRLRGSPMDRPPVAPRRAIEFPPDLFDREAPASEAPTPEASAVQAPASEAPAAEATP